MRRKAIFIAATGQNVGKTTVCLGLISALRKKFPNLGVMKPVGQQHKKVEHGLLVDKDVVLFKEYFNLNLSYEEMSPVIFHAGFTREYLDGKASEESLKKKIVRSFKNVYKKSDFTIVEGTGHVGVGSLFNLNNACVASLLNLEVVIIAKGGVGSCFDELALNKAMCDKHKVKMRGVILNRVYEEKKEMVLTYMSKALKRWDLPLIGCIPYNRFLNTPTMEDFEILFNTELLSGQQYHYCHFDTIRVVATSLEHFKEVMTSDQLIITPSSREDIVQAVIENRAKRAIHNEEPEHGLILTGHSPPSSQLIDKLKQANIPCLHAAKSSFETMRLITSFTAKICRADVTKVEKAIQLVEKHIDFSCLY